VDQKQKVKKEKSSPGKQEKEDRHLTGKGYRKQDFLKKK
jgi:hypothetical protein